MVKWRTWHHIFTLLKLAELGAHQRTVRVSVKRLAEKLGASQQSTSRYLAELSGKGWIERTVTREGYLVRITSLGFCELRKLYSSLRLLMEGARVKSVTLEGVVFTGLGEGAYYVTREGYRKQFMEKLGFDPYPGTLNLRLATDYDVKARSELEAYPAIEIDGFSDEGRTFGPAKCYHAIIGNKVRGAVVLALRSHYDSSVVEVIAPVYLRERLALKDGHKVKVEVLTVP